MPLVPGEPATVEIELEATSWVLEPGHRLRLALAGCDWPNTWPPPSAAELVIDRASVALTLPVIDGQPVAPPPALPPTTGVDTHSAESEEPQPPVVWRVERDLLGREVAAITASGYVYDGPFGARVEEHYDGRVGVAPDDPSRAWATAEVTYRISWPEADCAASVRLELRSDAESYHLEIDLTAEEFGDAAGGIGRVARRWEQTFPRRLA